MEYMNCAYLDKHGNCPNIYFNTLTPQYGNGIVIFRLRYGTT